MIQNTAGMAITINEIAITICLYALLLYRKNPAATIAPMKQNMSIAPNVKYVTRMIVVSPPIEIARIIPMGIRIVITKKAIAITSSVSAFVLYRKNPAATIAAMAKIM